MTLTNPGYRNRLIDHTVANLLGAMGAICIEGTRWCGKTWTSLNHAESAFFVADPEGNFRNRTIAELNLEETLTGKTPHAIDEWQEVPGIWDAVRFRVDQTPSPGQFILTGSSTPSDDAVIHSGIGRIARVRMRPMTLVESGDATGQVPLFNPEGKYVSGLISSLSLPKISELVVRGGWPGTLTMTPAQAGDLAQSYLDGIARIDASRIDNTRRDPNKIMALLFSLARNSATTVSQATICKDISEVSNERISPSSMREYLNVLERMFVLERIPAWIPALRSHVRLRESPKWLLVDPSLAAAAMFANPESLAHEPKTLGFLFEAMILRDLLIYAQHYRGQLHHYRDNANLEIDAILTLPRNNWLAIEIKLGFNQIDSAAAQLIRFRDKMLAGGHAPPTELIVLVGTGSYAHIRTDGVRVIPVDLLGV